MPISEPTRVADAAEWASGLAFRLRALRSQAIGDTVEGREAQLENEVRTSLQAVPIEDRPLFLKVLADTFPSWEEATRMTSSAQPVVKIEQTPEQVVDALVALAGTLSSEQREAVRARLSTVGLSSEGGLDPAWLSELKPKLKLSPTDPIDPQRLCKLFGSFAEVALALDQLVWNLWRSVAPQSSVRRELAPAEVRALMRRSLGGDAEASAAQVHQQLEATRQLIAGLLAGLGPAGESFGKRFHEQYAPDSIRAAVETEGGAGFFASAEARCWKKYSDLSTQLTPEAIETEVRTAIVKYAEGLIGHRNR